MRVNRVVIAICGVVWIVCCSDIMAAESIPAALMAKYLADSLEVSLGSTPVYFDYAVFTTSRAALDRKKNPNNEPIMIDSDEVVFVTTYSIVGVVQHGDAATAKVKFYRVAHAGAQDAEGGRRVFEVYFPYIETVVFHLVKHNNAWKVLDPPTLRVGLEQALEWYADSDKRISETQFKHLPFPEQQHKVFWRRAYEYNTLLFIKKRLQLLHVEFGGVPPQEER